MHQDDRIDSHCIVQYLRGVASRVPVEMVVESRALRAVLERARRFARVDATVMVTGESGVGKERVARDVHDHSRRAAGPFIPVNTGAIPENLLESELFGYLKGAFTGANRDAPGLFDAAQGGTLFLDEVGEMPMAMQAKLLRVLQEREIRPVGARAARPVDVRIVAATNADLLTRMAEGRFREDLYFRLNVVAVHVPALRDRPEDIAPLARLFLKGAAGRLGSPTSRLSADAAAALRDYAWPGNVRELENAMEHAAALTEGVTVARGALPDTVLGRARSIRPQVQRDPGIGAALTLAELERRHVEQVLENAHGNRTQAAAILGVAPSTLWRMLQRNRRTTA